MLLLDSFIDDVCGCDMQSLVSVHAWCLCILSGVPNSLLFSVITSRCLHSNASPAGFWPSLLRACGNTPPLIKFMSVEIATFNHFNILGTKEMLFPPSGGLESIKAALSVKISTVLGGRFFSPSPPPWRNYCSKAVPARGDLYCRPPDMCFVLFALSAKRLHPKINLISCRLERVFLCLHPTAHPWHCAMAVGGSIVSLWLLSYWHSLPVLLAGTGKQCGCQTKLQQLLSLCLRTAFALLTVFPICLGNLRDKPPGSPGCWAHWTLSCDGDQAGRSISFLVSLLLGDLCVKHILRIFCNMWTLLQTRAGWSSHTCQTQTPSTPFLLSCVLAGDHADFLSHSVCSLKRSWQQIA